MPKLFYLCLFLATLATNTITFASEDNNLSRHEIKHLLRHKIIALSDLAESPLLIKEVEEENRKSKSMDNILKTDRMWRTIDKTHPIKKQMYTSKTGALLKGIVEFKNSSYSEIFLTDNQGANITSWPITSDYWQGDEDKWSQVFNHPANDVFIGNLEFDESSNTNAVQISVPIIKDKKIIGVLIAGIKLTYLQAKYLRSQK